MVNRYMRYVSYELSVNVESSYKMCKQDLIIINNNCLKSNIQCIEIRVQWTVHLGSSHMHVHAVTRVHAVTPKLVICVMYLTSILTDSFDDRRSQCRLIE